MMEQTRQYLLTVEEGKKLIARGVAAREAVQKAAREHTLVIVAGTTNGYLAELMLSQLGEAGNPAEPEHALPTAEKCHIMYPYKINRRRCA